MKLSKKVFSWNFRGMLEFNPLMENKEGKKYTATHCYGFEYDSLSRKIDHYEISENVNSKKVTIFFDNEKYIKLESNDNQLSYIIEGLLEHASLKNKGEDNEN